ncbi:hypothetical protein BJY04DRAFT_213256 [Aspergillus karnatakaensis]|uniref:SANT/Myb-like DNA-binding domain-containing protein n=1 Tax=Aspergillus karnatakaensis TaxID=1810916 RepID=UPI003CCCB810
MPVLISNGKHYQMPFLSLLRGGVREERPLYDARSVSIDRYQDALKASSIRGQSNGAFRRLSEAAYRPANLQHALNIPPWTAGDERILRELRSSGVPWKRISMVLDDRPIEELRERWINLQDDNRKFREPYVVGEKDDWYFDAYRDRYVRPNVHEGRRNSRMVHALDDTNDDLHVDEYYEREGSRVKRHSDRRDLHAVHDLDDRSDDWRLDGYYDGRRVSFRTSSCDEEIDSEEDDSRRTKMKKIYYMDDEFTVDEVLLLHEIAVDWKKDRWETISSRFNDKTGRNITAAQARLALDD